MHLWWSDPSPQFDLADRSERWQRAERDESKGPDGDLRGRRTYLPPGRSNRRSHTSRDVHEAPGRCARVHEYHPKPLDGCHLQERAWKRARELAFPDPHRCGDDAIAACYPAPFELPLDHRNPDQERVRLSRILEHLDFMHHLDGVSVCDPTAGELDSALDELTKVVLG